MGGEGRERRTAGDEGDGFVVGVGGGGRHDFVVSVMLELMGFVVAIVGVVDR
jgi:hypothetical protein